MIEAINWLEGARCAVMLTFDFDSETNWLSCDISNLKRPGTLSQGIYGANVGVPRILNLLREEGLRATFFVPGWVAEHRTARVEAMVRDGHEIGHHGYLHKWIDPGRPEEDEILCGLESLKRAVGVTPTGFRAPYSPMSTL